MDEKTYREVKKFIKEFVSKTLKQAKRKEKGLSIERLREEYPFHSLFFKDEALLAFKMQRSLVTRMGRSLYPRLAEIIAKSIHGLVFCDHSLNIALDGGTWATINRIVDDLRHGRGDKPNHEAEIKRVLSSPQSGEAVQRPVRLDIFIPFFRSAQGKRFPVFIELKSPRPNLDICAETKRKILAFEAFMMSGSGRINLPEGEPLQLPQKLARGFIGFPYGLREFYDHSFTKQILDMALEVSPQGLVEGEVLIGPEFWDMLGGPGTFDQILEIVSQVQKETGFRDLNP